LSFRSETGVPGERTCSLGWGAEESAFARRATVYIIPKMR